MLWIADQTGQVLGGLEDDGLDVWPVVRSVVIQDVHELVHRLVILLHLDHVDVEGPVVWHDGSRAGSIVREYLRRMGRDAPEHDNHEEPPSISLRKMAWSAREETLERVFAWRAPNTPRCEVLWAENFANSFKILGPLAGRMKGVRAVTLAGRRKVCLASAAAGVPALHAAGVAVPRRRTLRSALQIAREARRRVSNIPGQLWAVLGPGAAELLKPALRNAVAHRMWQGVWHIAAARGAIAQTSPRAVMTTSATHPLTRAAIHVANQQGLETLYLQHGLRNPHALFADLLAGRLLLWGERDARALVESGVPSERCVVVGMPGAAAPQTTQGGSESQREGVLYLASRAGGSIVSSGVFRRTIEALRDASAALGVPLVVKLHPSDSSGIAEEVLDGAPGCSVTTEGDLTCLLRRAAVAVVTSSTTGLDACRLGVPLCVLNLTGEPEDVGYADAGAALGVEHAHDLVAALRTLMSDPDVRNTIAEGQIRLVADTSTGPTADALGYIAELVTGMPPRVLASAERFV